MRVKKERTGKQAYFVSRISFEGNHIFLLVLLIFFSSLILSLSSDRSLLAINWKLEELNGSEALGGIIQSVLELKQRQKERGKWRLEGGERNRPKNGIMPD